MDPIITSALITGGIQIGKSLLSGTMAAINSEANHNAKRNDLNYQIQQLGTQIDALDTSYRDSMDELTASLNQTLFENNYSLGTTGRAQQAQAELAAIANVESQSLLYEGLRDTQEQGLLSVGSAVARAAGSGFRNTEGTSVGLSVESAERTAARAYDIQKRQIQLSSYESYMSAAQSYFDANVQMEGYRRNIRNARENFDLRYESLTNEYNSNRLLLEAERTRYQSQYDEMGEWNWWIGVRDFFAGLV